jgi:branched-chain amino acid transport system ATP-binding protein
LALESSAPVALPVVQPALRLEGIVAGYHGNQVLHGVTVEARPGEVVLILGPNGTGKSTLLAVAAGAIRHRQGRVLLDGRDVSNEPPHKRSRAGIGYVPEGRRIFPRQSVHDNLLLGCFAARIDRVEKERRFASIHELFPVLKAKDARTAATLSGGEQQMLAIAQAVMANPRVLLLDEPSAGLAPLLTKQVFQQITRLRELGMTIIIVEQVAAALTIADRAYLMRNGAVVSEGPASAIAAQEMGDRYLGADT